MTGRNTTLSGPHIDAGWVTPVDIADEARQALDSLIGRKLTPHEVMRIQHACATARTRIRAAVETVTNQDVKRTLRHLEKVPSDLWLADDSTQAELESQLSLMGVDIAEPSVDAIAEAARLAQDGLPAAAGRRPKGWQRSLVHFAVATWQELGCQENMDVWQASSAQATLYDSSPLVMWAAAILEIAMGCKVAHSQVVRLLNGR